MDLGCRSVRPVAAFLVDNGLSVRGPYRPMRGQTRPWTFLDEGLVWGLSNVNSTPTQMNCGSRKNSL